MQDRRRHQREVRAFLQERLGSARWELTLPHGWGHETYYARDGERAYFCKLGAQLPRYQAMASLGLTPPVLAAGYLEDGTSIVVQPYIAGKSPSRADYCAHLEQFAAIIHKAHHSPEVMRALPPAPSDLYSAAGLGALAGIRQRWELVRPQIPDVAEFVDEALAELARRVGSFAGAGLVASHNDICNANWILSADGRLYLIDLEAMSPEDPALDIGATLWWYYPPSLRPRFLEIVGHADDEEFRYRMGVRMAMHCLHIILPREQSYDLFDPRTFPEALTDFKAAFAGEENPQGYED